MKEILLFIVVLLTTVLLLVACSDDHSGKTNSSEEITSSPSDIENETKKDNQTDKKEDLEGSKEDKNDDSNKVSSEENVNVEDQPVSEKSDLLSKYSSEEIEYARVWLQLGAMQDTEDLVLVVEQIPADTPLNPDDDTDVDLPEDVIQIRGSRIVDGIVTYSSNGDGTVNIYNIPYRWYDRGESSRPDHVNKKDVEKQMQDIIKNTDKVYIDPNDDEKVSEIIKHLEID